MNLALWMMAYVIIHLLDCCSVGSKMTCHRPLVGDRHRRRIVHSVFSQIRTWNWKEFRIWMLNELKTEYSITYLLSLTSADLSAGRRRDTLCNRFAEFVIKFLKFTIRLVRCWTWSSSDVVWSELASSMSFSGSLGCTPVSNRPYMPRQNLIEK